MSLSLPSLLATLVPKRLVLCCLDKCGGLTYYLANRLRFVLHFVGKKSPLLSFHQVFLQPVLLPKVNLYLKVLI